MKAIQAIALTLLCVMAASAQLVRFGNCPNIPTQANFDMSRYLGWWFQIKKLPAPFQRGECASGIFRQKSPGVMEALKRELLDDGSINSAVATISVKNCSEPAKLEISFNDNAPPGSYWVLSSDYVTHSVVYSCMNMGLFRIEFAWILSRQPFMSQETLHKMHCILIAAGIHPGCMVTTNQDFTYCLPIDDGSIDSGVGTARVKNPSQPAKLEVSFNDYAPPGSYWVLSSDYVTHSVVYSCMNFGLFRSEFAWILSREPTMSEETLHKMLSILSAAGLYVEKMVTTNQDSTYCAPMNV